MDKILKLPLLLEPAVEGGWVVRSPIIPELVTEIDHLDEMDEKIKDAVAAAKELYDDMGKEFPIADFDKYTGTYIKRGLGILESKASFSLKGDFEITEEELLSL